MFSLNHPFPLPLYAKSELSDVIYVEVETLIKEVLNDDIARIILSYNCNPALNYRSGVTLPRSFNSLKRISQIKIENISNDFEVAIKLKHLSTNLSDNRAILINDEPVLFNPYNGFSVYFDPESVKESYDFIKPLDRKFIKTVISNSIPTKSSIQELDEKELILIIKQTYLNMLLDDCDLSHPKGSVIKLIHPHAFQSDDDPSKHLFGASNWEEMMSNLCDQKPTHEIRSTCQEVLLNMIYPVNEQSTYNLMGLRLLIGKKLGYNIS